MSIMMSEGCDAFALERDLVKYFLLFLGDVTQSSAAAPYCMEFDYRRGRVDVIFLLDNNELVTVEAKLTRWKDALNQAYRNTSFSDRSYVVFPEPIALKALQFESEFEKRNVGICAVTRSGVRILRDAPKCEPLQPWLRDKAVREITEASCG